MAFTDDPEFLINHIRHSSVTSDDTGMCEMVIVNEEAENEKTRQRRRLMGGRFLKERDVTDFPSYSQSFDIAVSPELHSGSNTDMKRDPRKIQKTNELKCKNISWREIQEVITEEYLEDAFQKREVKAKSSKKTASQLSKQLVESSGKPDNPFMEYSKFDGEGYERTCPVKKLKIYLTMLPEDEAMMPMFVTVLGTASVQQLIGLVCYKYTSEGLQPELKNDIKKYCLLIAEDDGEVDIDFPPLDNSELMTKFGFNYLAFREVESSEIKKEEPAPPKGKPAASVRENAGIIVKVNEPKHGFSRVKVDSMNVKMKEVWAKMLKKRGLRRTGHEYVLEKQSCTGVPIDLNATLDSMETLEFCLVKGGRKVAEDTSDGDSKFDSEFVALGQYRPYRVNMLHKLRTSTEVQLGISLERIEIDPLTQPKTAKFKWVKQKPVSLSTEVVATCENLEDKSTGRSTFRIVYFSLNAHEYKHYDFEAESDVVGEIVHKVNQILRNGFSSRRSEYLSSRERKSEKRRSFR